VVGFGESGDPFGGGGEEYSVSGLAGPDGQADSEVSFACSWWAEEDYVVFRRSFSSRWRRSANRWSSSSPPARLVEDDHVRTAADIPELLRMFGDGLVLDTGAHGTLSHRLRIWPRRRHARCNMQAPGDAIGS
jgi:hypothetical protein